MACPVQPAPPADHGVATVITRPAMTTGIPAAAVAAAAAVAK